jgi:hypothetical protein
MAKRCHPDIGGDTRTMQRINQIVQVIEQHAQRGSGW